MRRAGRGAGVRDPRTHQIEYVAGDPKFVIERTDCSDGMVVEVSDQARPRVEHRIAYRSARSKNPSGKALPSTVSVCSRVARPQPDGPLKARLFPVGLLVKAGWPGGWLLAGIVEYFRGGNIWAFGDEGHKPSGRVTRESFASTPPPVNVPDGPSGPRRHNAHDTRGSRPRRTRVRRIRSRFVLVKAGETR